MNYLLTLISLILLNFGIEALLAPPSSRHSQKIALYEPFERPELAWNTLQGNWKIKDGWLEAQASNNLSLAPIDAPTQPYQLETRLEIQPRAKMGLIFNAQFPERLAAAQAVQLQQVGQSLIVRCGFFDQTGLWQLQDEVKIRSLTTQYKLLVSIHAFDYSVSLNGATVLKQQPLRYRGGLPGLMATANSHFDNLQLEPNNAQASVVSGDSSLWTSIGGAWQIESNLIRQQYPQGYDRSLMFNSQSFTPKHLRLQLRHTQGSGAGLIFNATNDFTLINAQMVRFDETGKHLFWGYFPSDGEFIGQGAADVGSIGMTTHWLEIELQNDTYSVWLDHHLLAQNLKLHSRNGYVGVTTSKSAAQFSLLDVTTTQGIKHLIGVTP
jgi:hypothetical protein